MYPYRTQTKAFRETDVWVEVLKWCFWVLLTPARAGEGARQQQTRLWKISGRAHWLSFRQSSESCSKSLLLWQWAHIRVIQRRFTSPRALSRQKVGDPLTKKKIVSKNMSGVFMHNGPLWKSIQCVERVGLMRVRILSYVEFMTLGMLNVPRAHEAKTLKADNGSSLTSMHVFLCFIHLTFWVIFNHKGEKSLQNQLESS